MVMVVLICLRIHICRLLNLLLLTSGIRWRFGRNVLGLIIFWMKDDGPPIEPNFFSIYDIT